jgi:hypothetical protein
MSTKIYGGMIATTQNPFTLQKAIKETVEPIFHARFKEAVDIAVKHRGEPWKDVFPDVNWRSARYEELTEEAIPESTMDITDKVYSLIKALQEDPWHTFSDLDFAYEVIILPNGRGLEYPPLVLLFSERAGDEYRNALIDAGVVKEYHYQNQSDQPEEISEEEWDERRKAWDEMDIPSEDGLSSAMVSKFNAWYGYARRNL